MRDLFFVLFFGQFYLILDKKSFLGVEKFNFFKDFFVESLNWHFSFIEYNLRRKIYTKNIIKIVLMIFDSKALCLLPQASTHSLCPPPWAPRAAVPSTGWTRLAPSVRSESGTSCSLHAVCRRWVLGCTSTPATPALPSSVQSSES